MGDFVLGLNPVQERNRIAVRLGKDMEKTGCRMFEGDNTLVGYVFREDGFYRKYYLVAYPDNIARFFCSSDKDKLLCNMQDYGIACSMGTFLDLAVDSFTELIMPYMEKYQKCGKYQVFEERKYED